MNIQILVRQNEFHNSFIKYLVGTRSIAYSGAVFALLGFVDVYKAYYVVIVFV